MMTQVGAFSPHAEHWHQIDWERCYRIVSRLQARIVKATQMDRNPESGSLDEEKNRVSRGLSAVLGNWPAAFLGEGAVATSPSYPTCDVKVE